MAFEYSFDKPLGTNISGITTIVDEAISKLPLPNISMSPSGKEAAESITNERLHKILPRSAETLYDDGQCTINPRSISDRGPISYIRLMHNPSIEDSSRPTIEGIDYSSELSRLKTKNSFNDFFLTDVSVSYNEKVQIMTTFGDSEIVYYFGKDPVIFNISGMVFDSLDNDWFTKFFSLYGTVLRGSQTARNYELVEITLPNMVIVGTIPSLSHQQNSQNDTIVNFSLQFIAKEIRPIPVPMVKGLPNFNKFSGSFVDFKVGKGGFGSGGFGVVLRDKLGNIKEVTGNLSGKISGMSSSIDKGLKSFGGNLTSFSSSIFSPVYGILSSITKTISGVRDLAVEVLSSFTDPVRDILRDVQNVSSQVIAIGNLIENSINDVIRVPERLISDAVKTAKSIERSAGVIARVPETVSQSMKRLKNMGRLKLNSTVISGNPKRKDSKTPLLNSGAAYTPKSGYSLKV